MLTSSEMMATRHLICQVQAVAKSCDHSQGSQLARIHMQHSFHYTCVPKCMLDKVVWLALQRSHAAYRILPVLPHSLCRNYKVVLENPGAEGLGLTFSVPATDVVGQNTERELYPGSGEVQVTDTNKEVCCKSIATYLCCNI